MYYFSSKNVCRLLDINDSLKGITRQKLKNIELFGKDDKIIKNLEIYEQITKNMSKSLIPKQPTCKVGKGIFKKHKLGEGTYGSVFSACLLNKSCTDKVAIKELQMDDMDDYRDFWNEITLQMQCSWCNITPEIIVAWTCKTNTGYKGYIVMDRLRKTGKNVTTQELNKIFSVLQQLKIVHMDLKQDNIFMTSNGGQLIDFGLSFQFGNNDKILPRYDNFGYSLYQDYKFNSEWDRFFYATENYTSKKKIYDGTFKIKTRAEKLVEFMKKKKNQKIMENWGIDVNNSPKTVKAIQNSAK